MTQPASPRDQLLNGEEEAVAQVLAHGAKYGYGNLIFRLKLAWADMLMREYAGFSEKAARRHVGLPAEK